MNWCMRSGVSMSKEFDRYWAIASARINLSDTPENAAMWQLLYRAAKNAYLRAAKKHGNRTWRLTRHTL